MTKIAMLWIEEEKLNRLKRKWKEEKRSQLWNSDLAQPNGVQKLNKLNNDENCIALNWRRKIEQIERKMEGGETVTAVK